MTNFESILKNFYIEPINENKYPKFGKAGRQDYLFTYKKMWFSERTRVFSLRQHVKARFALVEIL